MSDDQLLEAVWSLIDLESRVLANRTLQAEAEALLSNKPDVLVNRVVQHFRYLFQVRVRDPPTEEGSTQAGESMFD